MKNNQTIIHIEPNVKFIEFLNEFLVAVDSKIPTYVNAGGCGIFAYHLCKVLQSVGINAKPYVTQDETGERLDNLKKFIKSKDNEIPKMKSPNMIGVMHIITEVVDGIFFDSEGMVSGGNLKIKSSYPYFSEISLDKLKTLNEYVPAWNTMFDRDCEARIITELSKLPEAYEEFIGKGKHIKPQNRTKLTDYTINQSKSLNPIAALFQ